MWNTDCKVKRRGKEVHQRLFQWPQYHPIRTWTLGVGGKKKKRANGKDTVEKKLHKIR